MRDRLSACAGLKEIKLVTKRAPLQVHLQFVHFKYTYNLYTSSTLTICTLQVHLQRYFEFQCTVLSSDRKSNEDNLIVFMKIR